MKKEILSVFHYTAAFTADDFVKNFFGLSVDATVPDSHANYEWQKKYNQKLDELEKTL